MFTALIYFLKKLWRSFIEKQLYWKCSLGNSLCWKDLLLIQSRTIDNQNNVKFLHQKSPGIVKSYILIIIEERQRAPLKADIVKFWRAYTFVSKKQAQNKCFRGVLRTMFNIYDGELSRKISITDAWHCSKCASEFYSWRNNYYALAISFMDCV